MFCSRSKGPYRYELAPRMKPNNPKVLIPIALFLVLLIPTYWMDQLGIEKGTPFEGDKLAQQLRVLLETVPAKGADSR